MNKKIMYCAILLASSCYALSDEELQQKRLEWSKNYLESKGSVVIDGGVKIVPAKDMASYKESKPVIDKIVHDTKKYGYVKEDAQAQSLLTLKLRSDRHFKKNAVSLDPYDTNLKRSIGDIKMAYTFVGVPENEVTEIIGYAPAVTYIKGQGWVGASQFFTKSEWGTCSYAENNIRLSHAAIIIPKETARYDINGKTTTVFVKGTESTGFVYSINWYDNTLFRELSCANEKFDSSITDSMIEMAKVMDSQV